MAQFWVTLLSPLHWKWVEIFISVTNLRDARLPAKQWKFIQDWSGQLNQRKKKSRSCLIQLSVWLEVILQWPLWLSFLILEDALAILWDILFYILLKIWILFFSSVGREQDHLFMNRSSCIKIWYNVNKLECVSVQSIWFKRFLLKMNKVYLSQKTWKL